MCGFLLYLYLNLRSWYLNVCILYDYFRLLLVQLAAAKAREILKKPKDDNQDLHQMRLAHIVHDFKDDTGSFRTYQLQLETSVIFRDYLQPGISVFSCRSRDILLLVCYHVCMLLCSIHCSDETENIGALLSCSTCLLLVLSKHQNKNSNCQLFVL